MNQKIYLLSLLLSFSFMICMGTGIYKYEEKDLNASLIAYQEDNVVYHTAYKSVIASSIIGTTKDYKIQKEANNQFNKGIYYVAFETYYKYIKFFDDSTVMTVITNMPPSKAIDWINGEIETAARGTYSFKNGNITFTTIQERQEGEEVKVEYKGIQRNKTLILRSYSHATKKQSDLVYKYYK